MTELEKLKKMLVDAHNELRARKQKNTPTFGAMMFMLEAIVQCNKAIGEKNEQETGSTKYKNISESCQMARGQRLQATSCKLQAPSSKLDKKTI